MLWAWTEPARLSADAHAAVSDRDNDLLVSAATAWEIATKNRLGKLGRADGLIAGYARNLERLRARELLITSSHALLAGGLTWSHQDPFDRMIAAQGILEGLSVITADPALHALDGLATHW